MGSTHPGLRDRYRRHQGYLHGIEGRSDRRSRCALAALTRGQIQRSRSQRPMMPSRHSAMACWRVRSLRENREMSRKAGLVPSQFDAVAFDLDGVVTDTARVHFRAWKQTFDDFVQARSRREGVALAPFTLDDYRKHVDGRPREDAVRAFLAARGAQVPEGNESDGPDADTVNGLAERKDGLFLALMRRDGVDVYPSTVALIRRLRALGLKTAVVSASRNAQEILQTARFDQLFDVRVDEIGRASCRERV